MYWGEDETGMRGKFELYGEEARLKAGPRYTPDGEGNLVNVSGDTFYPAEPPAFVYDIVFDDDYVEYDDVPAPDDERFEADESDEAYDFCGCWEDAIDDVWLEINSDGTYLFMWDDGYGSAGDCYMDGDELCLESGTRFVYNPANGWIVSDDG